MKVCFICPGYQSGRNGVGDYTAMLASECKARGFQVLIVSVRDEWVDGYEVCEQVTESVHRIGLDCRQGRYRGVLQKILEFDPAWVSIQFVPHGFSSTGTRYELQWFLQKVCDRRLVHFMFHEVWFTDGNVFRRVQGLIQMRGIMGVVSGLNVTLCHTSNTHYAKTLGKCGISSGVLKLPGNIMRSNRATGWCYEELRKRGYIYGGISVDDLFVVGMFGSIQAEQRDTTILQELCDEAARVGRQCLILHVGSAGGHGRWLLRKWRSEIRGASVCELGQQSVARVSDCLQCFSIGVTSTPEWLLGKSGSVAAMIEHGVPIVSIRNRLSPAIRIAGAGERDRGYRLTVVREAGDRDSSGRGGGRHAGIVIDALVALSSRSVERAA